MEDKFSTQICLNKFSNYPHFYSWLQPANRKVDYKFNPFIMGLDMYVHRRIGVKNWDHEPKEDHYQVNITRGGKPLQCIRLERISYFDEELMRWWKANHIHKWFVDNVQGGLDDCGTYDISKDDLRKLHRVCTEVIKASKLIDGTVYIGTEYSKDHPDGKALREPGRIIEDATVAKELLPTLRGCFFGSTEYTEAYLDDVINTRVWIEDVLADEVNGVVGDIQYRADW